MKSTYNAEYLEVALDPESMRRNAAAKKQELPALRTRVQELGLDALVATGDASQLDKDREKALADLGRALQRLSQYCYYLQEYTEALDLKNEVLTIWQAMRREQAICLVRLQRARVLDALGQDQAALQVLQELRQATSTDSRLRFYHDFVLEALAIYYVRRAYPQAAASLLEETLEIRRQIGNAEMIQSTEALLKRVMI